ncbi:helix-turn-helix domain-containing protein [Rhodobacteraceae bacterium D3-12]|nr:helix-turn-helix domain-containing protein [Rhodobacteraceae bacterium D3-12]
MTSKLLTRYHNVLSTVAGADNGISAAAIAEAVDLPRSTAHRLALALCEVAYLQQNESSIFVLGPALDDILIPRLFNSQRSSTILPVLLNLANELQETSFFARRHCGRIEIVDALPVPGTHQSYIFPGLGDRPLDKCSSSKAILAFCEQQDVEAWFEQARGEVGAPELEYPTATFWAELGDVRDAGYAVCDGEIDEGVISIASPVFVEPFGAIYSIGVTGPTARMKSQSIEDVAGQVRAAAKTAAARLVAHSANMGSKPSRK